MNLNTGKKVKTINARITTAQYNFIKKHKINISDLVRNELEELYLAFENKKYYKTKEVK